MVAADVVVVVVGLCRLLSVAERGDRVQEHVYLVLEAQDRRAWVCGGGRRYGTRRIQCARGDGHVGPAAVAADGVLVISGVREVRKHVCLVLKAQDRRVWLVAADVVVVIAGLESVGNGLNETEK